MTTEQTVSRVSVCLQQHHSTEAALRKVKDNLLMNMDKAHVSLLVLLDLSAAFDTVDHSVVLQGLGLMFSVRGKALSWFQSYLKGRSQQISINGILSEKFQLEYGVPQGSCLGPLLFTIYTSELLEIFTFHLPSVHAYADGTDILVAFSPADSSNEEEAVATIENCICVIQAWMEKNKLMLNDDKTEILLIGTQKQLLKVFINRIKVGKAGVAPVRTT